MHQKMIDALHSTEENIDYIIRRNRVFLLCIKHIKVDLVNARTSKVLNYIYKLEEIVCTAYIYFMY